MMPSESNVDIERRFALACQTGDCDAIKALPIKSDLVNRILPFGPLVTEVDIPATKEILPQLNRGGLTGLMWAALFRRSSSVELLLENGASPNVTDEIDSYPSCRTALMYAVISDDSESTDHLLAAGGNPGMRDVGIQGHLGRNTALHYAARCGSNLSAEAILRRKKRLLHLKNDDGYAPLHVAVIQEHVALVRIFLKWGANPNLLNSELRQTAVHLAAENEEPTIMELLLEASGDPNSKSAAGETPMSIAIAAGRVKTLQSLVRAGGILGASELRAIKRAGSTNCMQWLRQSGMIH